MDLDQLGRSLRQRSPKETVTAAAGLVTAVAGTVLGALRPSSDQAARAAVTVNRPAQEAYAFWRELTNLPRFMFHLQEVVVTGPTTSHWRAAGPLGAKVEWDAEITEDVPGERIAWRSTNADVQHAGVVRFVPAPGDRGTEVHVELVYDAPGGAFGKALAKATGREPQQQVRDDLRRYKQVLETGEVTRSDGTPQGHSAQSQQVQHPAQPLEEGQQ